MSDRRYTRKDKEGVNSGMFMAYSILLAHVALIAAVGCLVLFFRGVVQYMFWIFLAFSAVIGYSAYRVYRRLKEERRNLADLMRLPEFSGKSVEVSLLGGLAAIRVNGGDRQLLPAGSGISDDGHGLLIEENTGVIPPDGPQTIVRELTDLARLYEQNLITLDEYEKTKQTIIRKMEMS
ncbi:MAG: hypothetical protein CSB33_04785 [Desulfobacterales bacterium]|nr:MAG: hypothetical protein CSB33_04785 [Desulfobacterales bacterium]